MPSLEQTALAQGAAAQMTVGEPDLVVVNARVFTSDTASPRAEAFAVKNGRFVAVGSTSDVRNLATARTPVIDAQRMFVTPGFIDAHCHPSGVEELYGVDTNLRTVREIQAAIKKKAEATPPGFWVTGFMFDDTKLDRPLNRKDLDEATTEHPVSIGHRGGHTAWYNSKAFELAGITADTPDPSDGRFFKANGQLTGQVAENARDVFDRVGKREAFTPEQQRARARNGMRHMSQLFNACGLTSVHNAWTTPEHILAYEDCRKHGELTHRAYMMIQSEGTFGAFKAAGVYTGFGDEWIRVGGIKFVADGSASERTMRMSTPYVGTNDYGILTMTQEQIYEAVDDAHSHDFQIGIHANGDVTIDSVLKAYERALQKWPDPNRRHRIEHCTLVNPDLIRRIKASGVIPTPFWIVYHRVSRGARSTVRSRMSVLAGAARLSVPVTIRMSGSAPTSSTPAASGEAIGATSLRDFRYSSRSCHGCRAACTIAVGGLLPEVFLERFARAQSRPLARRPHDRELRFHAHARAETNVVQRPSPASGRAIR
jgi:predicted amidohydrolase YtcJ